MPCENRQNVGRARLLLKELVYTCSHQNPVTGLLVPYTSSEWRTTIQTLVPFIAQCGVVLDAIFLDLARSAVSTGRVFRIDMSPPIRMALNPGQ